MDTLEIAPVCGSIDTHLETVDDPVTLRPWDGLPAFSISRCIEHPDTCPKPDLFSGSLSSWLPGRRLHILRITIGVGFCGHPAHRRLAAGYLLPMGRANGGLLRSERPFCMALGGHFTPGFIIGWKPSTRGLDSRLLCFLGQHSRETIPDLGLPGSRFIGRSCMTTLLPCLHSSFTITTCSTHRRFRLAAYRLYTHAL